MATQRTASDILAENRRCLSMDDDIYDDNIEEDTYSEQGWQEHDIAAMQEAYRQHGPVVDNIPATSQDYDSSYNSDSSSYSYPPAAAMHEDKKDDDFSVYAYQNSSTLQEDSKAGIVYPNVYHQPFAPNPGMIQAVKRLTVGGQTSQPTVTIRPATDYYPPQYPYYYQPPCDYTRGYGHGGPVVHMYQGDNNNNHIGQQLPAYNCQQRAQYPQYRGSVHVITPNIQRTAIWMDNKRQKPAKPRPTDDLDQYKFREVQTTSKMDGSIIMEMDPKYAMEALAKQALKEEKSKKNAKKSTEPKDPNLHGRSNRCYDAADEIYTYDDSVFQPDHVDFAQLSSQDDQDLDLRAVLNMTQSFTSPGELDDLDEAHSLGSQFPEAVGAAKRQYIKASNKRRLGFKFNRNRKRGRPKSVKFARPVVHHFPGVGSQSVTLLSDAGTRSNKSLTAINAPELLVPNVHKSVDVRKAVVSAYIDQLVLENELITEMSDTYTPPTSLCLTHEDYVKISFSVPAQFPSSKFRQWVSACLPQVDLDTICSKEEVDIDSKRPCTRYKDITEFIDETFYGCRRDLVNQCLQQEKVAVTPVGPIVSSSLEIVKSPHNPGIIEVTQSALQTLFDS